jgi:hypothetical protein
MSPPDAARHGVTHKRVGGALEPEYLQVVLSQQRVTRGKVQH